jgi:zeaxanthin glucosyltransferase
VGKIALAIAPEHGHVNATRHLAKVLSARGHDVWYVGLESHTEFFRSAGLPYQAIAVDDTLKLNVSPTSEENPAKEVFWPDLVLADAAIPRWGLMAYRNGIPFARLSTTFPLGQDDFVPPFTCTLEPGPWVRSAWWARAASFRIERFKVAILRRDDWYRSFRQLVKATGYPERDVDFRSAATPLLQCPELVLVSRAFDFPRPDTSARHYLGLSIDTGREEADLPLLDESRPLVYCAYGSQLHADRDLTRRLMAMFEVAKQRAHLEFVIGAGSLAQELPPAPCNVHVLEVAPQLKLLKRAVVMFSHGGLNSVKEALYFGVPLVVSPVRIDQPGNAARVVYHGLGLMVKQPSPRRLGAALDRILSNRRFAMRSQEASRYFRIEQESGVDVGVVETLLNQRRSLQRCCTD